MKLPYKVKKYYFLKRTDNPYLPSIRDFESKEIVICSIHDIARMIYYLGYDQPYLLVDYDFSDKNPMVSIWKKGNYKQDLMGIEITLNGGISKKRRRLERIKHYLDRNNDSDTYNKLKKYIKIANTEMRKH